MGLGASQVQVRVMDRDQARHQGLGLVQQA